MEKCKVKIIKANLAGKADSPNDIQKFQNECYAYMAELAKLIFENEERREDSLIQQAGHMQTAFSFVIAAMFMVAAILIEYRGVLSLEFLLIVFSSITLVLLSSLFFATMAQNRIKRKDFPQICKIKEHIQNNYDLFRTPAQRSKYLLETYETMHASYELVNNKRQKCVKISMKLFYISLILCAFWFVVAIIKII